MANDALAWGRLIGRQDCFQAFRRLFDARGQGTLAQAGFGCELADRVGERVGKDRSQPGDLFRIGRAAELVTVLMGLQQRLLDEVRRIELGLNLVYELLASQEQQVGSIGFHRTHGNDLLVVRAGLTYGLLTDERVELSARGRILRIGVSRRANISSFARLDCPRRVRAKQRRGRGRNGRG